MIIIYRGGTQFKDSIKYYMQSIYFDFFSKLKRKQRMNIVVTKLKRKQRMNIVVTPLVTILRSKTCFVIARRFFLSVLI